jgi:hypothetical protein
MSQMSVSSNRNLLILDDQVPQNVEDLLHLRVCAQAATAEHDENWVGRPLTWVVQ